jgi:hypothetical protein
LHNMYDKTKSCVKAGNKISFFASNAGVWQGENISPVLSSLFLNDLEKLISEK